MTMVSASEEFLFKPNTIYVPFGKPPEAFVFELRGVFTKRHIPFIHAVAERVDAKGKRLIAGGCAKPAYDRKGHLKAIWLFQEDGGNPVEMHPRRGTRYSSLQNLDSGNRCWKLRRVDGRDDDGVDVSTRNVFLQVIADCTIL